MMIVLAEYSSNVQLYTVCSRVLPGAAAAQSHAPALVLLLYITRFSPLGTVARGSVGVPTLRSHSVNYFNCLIFVMCQVFHTRIFSCKTIIVI